MDPRIAQAVSLLDAAHDLERASKYARDPRANLKQAETLRRQSRRLVQQAGGTW